MPISFPTAGRWTHAKWLGVLFLISMLVSTFGPTFIHADQSTTSTPRAWIGDTSVGAPIRVDARTNRISVTVNHDRDHIPQSVGIILISPAGKRTELELKSVERLVDAGASQSRFSSSLDSNSASFVGFQIKIPFRSKYAKETPAIIRSESLRKVE